jgi:hypothetical protein
MFFGSLGCHAKTTNLQADHGFWPCCFQRPGQTTIFLFIKGMSLGLGTLGRLVRQRTLFAIGAILFRSYEFERSYLEEGRPVACYTQDVCDHCCRQSWMTQSHASSAPKTAYNEFGDSPLAIPGRKNENLRFLHPRAEACILSEAVRMQETARASLLKRWKNVSHMSESLSGRPNTKARATFRFY